MTTKAETFRVQQQRKANPPRPKQPRRARRDLDVDTSKPGVSATDRKATRSSNRNSLAGRRGGAALEGAARTSRKSTRKSADGTKRTTNQQLRAIRKSRSPSTRAARAEAAGVGTKRNGTRM